MFVPASDADRSILRERDFRINTKIRTDLKQPRNYLDSARDA
ncbi:MULTISPECIES: hypothetical protein [Pseudomonas]|nr:MULTISPECIES: hypothetical protein [Pseudomonas]